MKKQVSLLLIFLLVLPVFTQAKPIEDMVSVAFIREGYLWLKMNGEERKITHVGSKYTYQPQWSHDGKWVAYQVESKKEVSGESENPTELWVYNVETKKHKRIAIEGYNPQWSPVETLLAFKIGGVLNISNLDRFYNIALGVGDFGWHPDGRSFIAASGASLRPDGWTNPVLFKIGLERNLDASTSLTKNVTKLFTIPSELKKGNVSLLAIDATRFQFSPDGKWISFIVSPTASWSMDSDFVCIISSDGQHFEVLDETNGEGVAKWAPHLNRLGYIAGGGRIVFGFKNKNMKVTELPAFTSINLTPKYFAEMGFTWKDDHSLLVSRVKEMEWSNDPKKRPDPSLFLIKIGNQQQAKITNPPRDFGDYNPSYLSSVNKVTWLRIKDVAEIKRDLWIGDTDGKNAKLWIKNIREYNFFEDSNKKSP
ncbi:TolB domain-containing protein [Bacillus sp. JJ1764]|uniref:TolB domain-containing protein n=1 Tax=Bacillus sp. JJ1764 TaxID=3122964 RepID=UPI002FFD7785